MPLFKKFLIFAILLIVGIGAYLFQKDYFHKKQTTFDPPYPEVNTSGDPILTVFEGRIPYTGNPCDVCEKIKISLVLYQDKETEKPTTYWLGQVAVGEGNDRDVTQGSWTIQHGIKGYPTAEVYKLDENTSEDMRMYWRVNDDILLPLDKNMTPKVGNAAWGYMLSRYKEPYGPRTY